MVTKKSLWNLHYGNRGFILTLDILIALLIVMSAVIVSTTVMVKSSNKNLILLQVKAIGEDIATVLDYKKDFDTLYKNSISNNIKALLPENFEMSYKLGCPSITIYDTAPQKRFTGTGKRVIVTSKGEYCLLEYWIWPK